MDGQLGIYAKITQRTNQHETGQRTARTLYDGFSFQEIRAGETFTDGSLTTRYGSEGNTNRGTEGSRYRWIGEGENGTRTRSTGEYSMVTARWTGASVTLYGKGEAVAVSAGSRAVYLGKDQMGSVRSATDGYGALDERYEYDAFGVPYTGDLTQGMNLGYTGKPYDAATGLYNYGYRDYAPSVARFTTVDPIRDGSNWFAYVNNDPVNYVDLWGLSASDENTSFFGSMVNVFTQLFKDDGSTSIFTSGLSASGTTGGWSGSVGAGFYMDPKNDLVYATSKVALLNPITAPVASLLMIANIGEAGFYVDGSVGFGKTFGTEKYAGSLSWAEGIFTSRKDAEGPYFETGGSVSGAIGGFPLSVGGDVVFSTNGEPIGFIASPGAGAGVPFETHVRFGATLFVPLFKSEE